MKRRPTKRRLGAIAEIEAWATYFDCGCDFGRDLPTFGVPVDASGRPDAAVSIEAWHRLGAQYLADPEPKLKPHATLWALLQFGDPHAT